MDRRRAVVFDEKCGGVERGSYLNTPRAGERQAGDASTPSDRPMPIEVQNNPNLLACLDRLLRASQVSTP
jgi:hypothetical protein